MTRHLISNIARVPTLHGSACEPLPIEPSDTTKTFIATSSGAADPHDHALGHRFESIRHSQLGWKASLGTALDKVPKIKSP